MTPAQRDLILVVFLLLSALAAVAIAAYWREWKRSDRALDGEAEAKQSLRDYRNSVRNMLLALEEAGLVAGTTEQWLQFALKRAGSQIEEEHIVWRCRSDGRETDVKEGRKSPVRLEAM